MFSLSKKIAFSFLTFFCVYIIVNAQTNFKVIKTFKVGGDGGWDYIASEPNGNRLFLSHGTQVNVIDKNTGNALGIIPNTIGVHGIAFVPTLNKGYTSNGKSNNATVFNLKTLAILDSIPTGQKPDAIFYDKSINKIVICNSKSQDLTLIDPTTDKVVATIKLEGSPEAAVSDGEGKLFVNLEDKNEIAVVDSKSYKVISNWSIAPGENPTGLVIDTKTNRLFSACENNLLVVVDASSGKMINKLPIGGGCDGAVFDPELKNIYTSNGADGTISVFHEESAQKAVLLETIVTKRGARTIAIDEKTHQIYLPTAEIESSSNGKRGKVVSGSFQVLVVGK